MKIVAATEAKNRFGAVLDDAQRGPVVIRKQDRDVAVVLSMAEYERIEVATFAPSWNCATKLPLLLRPVDSPKNAWPNC